MTTRHFTPAQARVRATLIHQMIDRHGLTEAEADNALTEAECGLDGPHTHLVHAETRAAVTEGMAPIAARFRELYASMEAVRPAMEAYAAAMRRIVEHLRAAEVVGSNGKPARAPDRPAWHSPYGPPPKRRI